MAHLVISLVIWFGIGLPIIARLHDVTVLPGILDRLARVFLAVRNDGLSRTVVVLFLGLQSILITYAMWRALPIRRTAALVLFTILVMSLAGLVHYLIGFDSVSRDLRGFYFYWGMFGGLLAVAFSLLFSTEFRKHLVICWATVCFVAFWLSWVGLEYAQHYYFQGHLRWAGVFINPNVYGAFSALSVIFCVGVLANNAFETRQPWRASMLKTLIFSLLLVVNLAALVNSYSRSAWIGLVFGLVIVCGRIPFRKVVASFVSGRTALDRDQQIIGGGLSKRRITMWHLGVIAIVLSAGVGTFVRGDQLDMILQRSATLGDSGDRSVTNRAKTWRDAVPMVFARAGGWGWEDWHSSFNERFRRSDQTSVGSITLNDHLSIGIVYGWPIALLWGAALIAWFAHRLMDKQGVLVFALLVTAIPSSVANNVIFDPSLGCLWWGLLVWGAVPAAKCERSFTEGEMAQHPRDQECSVIHD